MENTLYALFSEQFNGSTFKNILIGIFLSKKELIKNAKIQIEKDVKSTLFFEELKENKLYSIRSSCKEYSDIIYVPFSKRNDNKIYFEFNNEFYQFNNIEDIPKILKLSVFL